MMKSRGRGRLGGLPLLFCGALALTSASCEELVGGNRARPAPILWRTPVTGKFAGTISVPVTDDQRMYISGRGVAAFDVRTGAQTWVTPPFDSTIPTFIAARGGRVFAAEAVAHAYDAATGQELWRFTPDADASLGQSAADEQSFYFGTDTRRLYALNVVNGTVRWSQDLGLGWQYPSPVRGVAVSGDTVYAAVERIYSANRYYAAGVIVALDRNTGRELWRYQNGDGTDPRGVIGAPTVMNQWLFFSDPRSRAFVAVDRFTGQQVWRTETEPGFSGPESPPVVAEGVVYGSAIDAYVYALSPETGRVVWKTRPALGGSHYHAVCGRAVFNNLGALGVTDRKTGRLLGLMFRDGDRVRSGFAVSGDRIFFVTNEAAFALKCP